MSRNVKELFGALRLNDDVRLCNEVCNTTIRQRGAVMSLNK